MSVRPAEDFLKRLKKRKPVIYSFGEKVENVLEHPNTKPVVDTICKTYELALDPKNQNLHTMHSPFVNEPVNRFNHIVMNANDLAMRVKQARHLSQSTGTCTYRCPAHDGLNALYAVTYELDQANQGKTKTHEHFLEFLKEVQAQDLACNGTMTDVKGDRSLKPHQQGDMYLHLVDKNKDGITVRGAKVHQSGAIAVDYSIVMPTLALGADDELYAVSFAAENGTPGIMHVLQANSGEAMRRIGGEIDQGNIKYSVRSTSLMIFEQVFIPWKYVFLCEDYAASGLLLKYFTDLHRTIGSGCKAGFADTIIGAAATIAEFNGVTKASHIQSKLIDMIQATETAFGTALAACCEGEKTPAGSFVPNTLMANVTKLAGFGGLGDIIMKAAEIAGGLCVTAPSEKDLRHPEIGSLVEKYLKGSVNVSTEDRLRMMKFIHYWAAGPHPAGAIHGGGSPMAQKMMLPRCVDFEKLKNLAKVLAGIKV